MGRQSTILRATKPPPDIFPSLFRAIKLSKSLVFTLKTILSLLHKYFHQIKDGTEEERLDQQEGFEHQEGFDRPEGFEDEEGCEA